jgi:inorganic pyrophosphatase
LFQEHLLTAREPDSGRVHVVIDTPAGSRNKYKYDLQRRIFRVSRTLPDGLVFPHDFGWIPQTRAADGDPLDILVLSAAPTFPGCLVTARLLGVLHAYQLEGKQRVRNDRLIGVAETPVNVSELKGLRSLEPLQLRSIERFFESYNELMGRKFRVTGRGNQRAAEAQLEQAMTAFAEMPR